MKLLYNTITQLFKPYPRSDDAEVIGLDPIYQVFTVNQDSEPSYDPGTHHLEATESVDHESKTITRGWNVVATEAPPISVTKLSFSLACGELLWSDIKAAVASISDPADKSDAEKYLAFSQIVTRNHPLVIQLAAALGLSDAQVDAVFAAAKILDETP